MALYVRLVRFTERHSMGKDATTRFQKAKRIIQRHGAKLLQAYVTLGRFDLVSVIEAKDDKTIARISCELFDALGLQAETMPAIPLEEHLKAIGSPRAG